MVTVKPRNRTAATNYDWFKPLIDKTIEDKQPLWVEPRDYIRISEIGTECNREITFNMLGLRVPFPADKLRIFRTGNVIEDVNIEVMKKAGIFKAGQEDVEYNYPLSEDVEIPFAKGHYDAIVTYEGVDYTVEIKSIKEQSFEKLPPEHGPILAGQSPLFLQFPKYIHQWNTYAGKLAPSGFILFEAKNTQRQKVYYLLHDQELLANLFYKVQGAWEYAFEGCIAPVPDNANPNDPKDKLCGRCDKRFICNKLDSWPVKLADVKKKDLELRG